jgi:rSAM/selenodomain-associated transferase 1
VAVKLIILFAKSPLPGRVKTRLLPTLSPELAADLHSAFVRDMINRFHDLRGTHFELHTDTESDAWQDLAVTRKVQIRGDLGLKMVHALGVGLASGYDRVVIVGSDAPTVPVAHVTNLLESTADVALGPATDGGFYAIAARKTHECMFDGVTWSQADTMARTVHAIHRTGLTVELGAEWFDVDEPDDLEILLAASDVPPHTAACLQRITALPDSGLSARSAAPPAAGPLHQAPAKGTSAGPSGPARNG